MYAWGGAVTGPFLGVWMSLVAVKHTEAGVAMAIMSIVPVLVIPWVIIFFKEKVSLRAVLGAVLAVCGVFILFLH
jgi:drug/metabolite transporter (DMT)-like permease